MRAYDFSRESDLSCFQFSSNAYSSFSMESRFQTLLSSYKLPSFILILLLITIEYAFLTFVKFCVSNTPQNYRKRTNNNLKNIIYRLYMTANNSAYNWIIHVNYQRKIKN